MVERKAVLNKLPYISCTRNAGIHLYSSVLFVFQSSSYSSAPAFHLVQSSVSTGSFKKARQLMPSYTYFISTLVPSESVPFRVWLLSCPLVSVSDVLTRPTKVQGTWSVRSWCSNWAVKKKPEACTRLRGSFTSLNPSRLCISSNLKLRLDDHHYHRVIMVIRTWSLDSDLGSGRRRLAALASKNALDIWKSDTLGKSG